MTPLASLRYRLSRCDALHTPLRWEDWGSAIQLAQAGGKSDTLATRAEYAAMRARAGVVDTAEEVALRVLAVCLRWRISGDRSTSDTEAAWRHAERLIERSELRRDKPCQ